MKEIILATANAHKVSEIMNILKGLDIKLLPLNSFSEYPHTVEDAETIEGNAIKKAVEASEFFNLPALADDSGLEVEYLGGRPGIFSARYAGDECIYENNNRKLLKELEGVPNEKRKARFVCVMALACPHQKPITVFGTIDGFITQSPSGTGGFGYDPIFFIPQYNKTFAEIGEDLKNKISHRAKALADIKKILASQLTT